MKLVRHDPPSATYRCIVEAGVFMRGKIRRELEATLFQLGLDYDIKEDKRLLDSTYYVTGKGPLTKVLQFQRWYERMAAEFN